MVPSFTVTTSPSVMVPSGLWRHRVAVSDVVHSVFNADFAGDQDEPTPSGADLAWSPGSEPALPALIGSARHSLAVENEEMENAPIVSALVAVARFGVGIQVTMTYDSSCRPEFLDARRCWGRRPPVPGHLVGVVHPRQGHRRRCRYRQRETIRRLGELLDRVHGLQPRARHRHHHHAVVDELATVLGQHYDGAAPASTAPTIKPTVTATAPSSATAPQHHASRRYYKPGEYCPRKDLNKTITDPYATMTCEEPPGGGQPRWVASRQLGDGPGCSATPLSFLVELPNPSHQDGDGLTTAAIVPPAVTDAFVGLVCRRCPRARPRPLRWSVLARSFLAAGGGTGFGSGYDDRPCLCL